MPVDDSIKIYSAKRLKRSVDTSSTLKLAFPAHALPDSFTSYSFRHPSFDIDVLNILFKLRPVTKGFPPQFNNNILNAAVFVGKRTDLYYLRYTRTPLGIYNRSIAHYGYSVGIFSGFGASRIDEYVTCNGLSIQYDGLVNLSGIAVIIAFDKLNFGINAGFDHLFDRHRNIWIYQGKPWLGVSLGLNLN